ncbi:hypothetical protein ASPSYDRAFT_45240 [Aspergillus sydowii CBS 593.65]|uniref:Uncharacterized protein n=1 Tax=Aspergillus sydowii CBS 593.65 TaxID=1036612 RepID=A0A1L9THD7_9EURO|nr:uncharacterized protein ASPSYDRAFT_45240 [Aspergillus sydowii CBS 593.65]OJJ58844.1 hypothetical protein ASPSYDRAFT_45240 [Aspergillus sydowii CBS 593.65]
MRLITHARLDLPARACRQQTIESEVDPGRSRSRLTQSAMYIFIHTDKGPTESDDPGPSLPPNQSLVPQATMTRLEMSTGLRKPCGRNVSRPNPNLPNHDWPGKGSGSMEGGRMLGDGEVREGTSHSRQQGMRTLWSRLRNVKRGRGVRK